MPIGGRDVAEYSPRTCRCRRCPGVFSVTHSTAEAANSVYLWFDNSSREAVGEPQPERQNREPWLVSVEN